MEPDRTDFIDGTFAIVKAPETLENSSHSRNFVKLRKNTHSITNDSSSKPYSRKKKRVNVTSETVPGVTVSTESIASPTKEFAPALGRLSREQTDRLTSSNRAAYVALPKEIIQRRISAFSCLQSFIAEFSLRGLTTVVGSGYFYKALIFDTTDHRDRAVNKLLKAKYKWDGSAHKLIVRNFGDPRRTTDTIWHISQDPLATGDEIVAAVQQHITCLEPELSTSFIVKPVKDSEYLTGQWAVKFEENAPKSFKSQIQVGAARLFVRKELANSCRFCGKSGHSIFECTAKADKELGDEVYSGKIGGIVDRIQTQMVLDTFV